MKDYLNEINDAYPIRRRRGEKADFYHYVAGELGERRVKRETIGKHENIIIGDPEKAKVLVTAHYDTPAASPVPNFMIPANKILCLLVNLCFPVSIALASLLLAFGIGAVFSLDETATIVIYLVVYFSAFFGCTRLFANRHNKNDNTSGVAAVLTLAARYGDDKAAFILFDNEEKGLLGSKAFYKQNAQMMGEKLLVNLDCVGNGDQFVCIVKEKAEKSEAYRLLAECLVADGEPFAIHHIPFQKSRSNSDHKNFPCAVGVMAARKGKMFKFITGRIHTARDTVADSGNIAFLAGKLGIFLEKL